MTEERMTELQSVFAREAAAALERVAVRLRWRANLAAPPHSAVQELIGLIEFMCDRLYREQLTLAKASGEANETSWDTGDKGKSRVEWLLWTETSDGGSESPPLVEFGERKRNAGCLSVHLDPPPILEGADVSWDVRFRVVSPDKPESPDNCDCKLMERLLKEQAREHKVAEDAAVPQSKFSLLKSTIANFLLDYWAIPESRAKPERSLLLGGEDPIKKAAEQAQEAFTSRRNRCVKVKIMSYVPPCRTKDGVEEGFLFYEYYPDQKWHHTIKAALIRGTYPSKDEGDKLPLGRLWETKTGGGGKAGGNGQRLARRMWEVVMAGTGPGACEGPEGDVGGWEFNVKIRNALSGTQPDQEDALRHVIDSLADRVGSQSSFDLGTERHLNQFVRDCLAYPGWFKGDCLRENTDGNPDKPLIVQKESLGRAGRAARSYVSELVHCQEREPDLVLESRISDPEYFIMGLLEAPAGVGAAGKSAIVVPLLGKGQLLGVMIATREKDEPAERDEEMTLDHHDLRVLESVAARTSLCIQEARDMELFSHLAASWNKRVGSTSEAKGQLSLSDAYEAFLKELLHTSRYVVNASCLKLWRIPSQSMLLVGKSGDARLDSLEIVDQVHGAPLRTQSSLSVYIEDAGLGHFVKWSGVSTDELDYAHESQLNPPPAHRRTNTHQPPPRTGCTVHLYLPPPPVDEKIGGGGSEGEESSSGGTANREGQPDGYLLAMELAEPRCIFLENKLGLELLFNYIIRIAVPLSAAAIETSRASVTDEELNALLGTLQGKVGVDRTQIQGYLVEVRKRLTNGDAVRGIEHLQEMMTKLRHELDSSPLLVERFEGYLRQAISALGVVVEGSLTDASLLERLRTDSSGQYVDWSALITDSTKGEAA
jgi:hypothetical protein